MEMKIVAVWINVSLMERIDDYSAPVVFSDDTVPGENHGKMLTCECL